ncbi:aldehyde dehydrogenase family protein [Sinorhizobium mexicanum]|uniref:Aldehyde dehydrogenase family protein n=1 Tax=Sinorhizobium mexicanum TaxID=375549 RepID=A0A859QI07_9HYPH|nr:aldehyde dehydrogenase family protein [Sinorhizobium mexicanum]MBP1881742.1 aldehyde dehydrogenase (NAD+) [Sinorhizobium mexicanum]QLL61500.1 aldehyde dehydrogenase family protein [Sinorhizobium mexicanum]
MENAHRFYIDGKWVEPAGGTTSDLIDPATEKVYATVAMGSAEDIDRAVKAAREAFATYSRTTVEERIGLLQKIEKAFVKREREISETVTQEVGMPISVSSGFLLDWCKLHIAETIEILRRYEFSENLGTTTVYKEPIGVVGMITPWNFPIGQIFTKILPALATGCTMVLKPSQLTPLDGIIVAEILHEAGVPAGVFNLVNGDGRVVGEAISQHPDIDMVSFTGSTRAGIQIAKSAADTIKRVVNELGGKSANILLDDADFETAVENAVGNCFFLNGQACDAGTRLLVPRNRIEEATNIAVRVANGYVSGPPSDPSTTLGPVMNENQFKNVQKYIQSGIDEGAHLVAGGVGKPDGIDAGYFVKPTIFSDVTPEMTIYREEIFGPVLSISAYEDLADAARMANDTVYGLAAHVTGKDMDKVRQLSRELRAGSVYVNSPDFDPKAPFGGYRQSGNGRECGEHGFTEFLEIKAVVGHG